VIPRFMFALLDGTRPTVFGDGEQSRDFTYIDNVVAANLAACTAPGAAGQAFNVASGSSQSLLRLLELLEKLTGKKADPEFGPPRTGDVRYSLPTLAG
jgi:UDP-N-acetylglucosamine 4-epimerase